MYWRAAKYICYIRSGIEHVCYAWWRIVPAQGCFAELSKNVTLTVNSAGGQHDDGV